MSRHHAVVRRVAPGVTEVVRPLRDTSWWHRWRQERACRRATGHCWHPEDLIGWWCCMCSGETDGMPKQECGYCLERPYDEPERPITDERPWTGPEQIRHALAITGGWAWCDEHRRSPWREGGCQHLHPELQYRPHAQECLVEDECRCGAEGNDS